MIAGRSSATSRQVAVPSTPICTAAARRRDLGTLPGGTNSTAYGINNSGQVVGTADTSTGASDGFLYSGGTMHDIGTFGGDLTWVNGINSSGQIVGWSYTSAGRQDAFVYSNGTMQDLSNLVVSPAHEYIMDATAINDAGQIVGYDDDGFAFLLTPAVPGDANGDGRVDINDLTIVLARFGQSTGMNWSTGDFIGDGTVDVNDLTIVLANYGQTAGAAGIKAVPEPSSVVLLGAGAIALLGYAWGRRP